MPDRANQIGEGDDFLIDLEILEHEPHESPLQIEEEQENSRAGDRSGSNSTSSIFLVYCSPALLLHCSISAEGKNRGDKTPVELFVRFCSGIEGVGLR